jgi:hypothetical protein
MATNANADTVGALSLMTDASTKTISASTLDDAKESSIEQTDLKTTGPMGPIKIDENGCKLMKVDDN